MERCALFPTYSTSPISSSVLSQSRCILISHCSLVFTKCKESLQDGRRLENIAWRLWHREMILNQQGYDSDDDCAIYVSSNAQVDDRSPSPISSDSEDTDVDTAVDDEDGSARGAAPPSLRTTQRRSSRSEAATRIIPGPEEQHASSSQHRPSPPSPTLHPNGNRLPLSLSVSHPNAPVSNVADTSRPILDSHHRTHSAPQHLSGRSHHNLRKSSPSRQSVSIGQIISNILPEKILSIPRSPRIVTAVPSISPSHLTSNPVPNPALREESNPTVVLTNPTPRPTPPTTPSMSLSMSTVLPPPSSTGQTLRPPPTFSSPIIKSERSTSITMDVPLSRRRSPTTERLPPRLLASPFSQPIEPLPPLEPDPGLYSSALGGATMTHSPATVAAAKKIFFIQRSPPGEEKFMEGTSSGSSDAPHSFAFDPPTLPSGGVPSHVAETSDINHGPEASHDEPKLVSPARSPKSSRLRFISAARRKLPGPMSQVSFHRNYRNLNN